VLNRLRVERQLTAARVHRRRLRALIPRSYLDLIKINPPWFADEVRAIRVDPRGRLAVSSRGIRQTRPLKGPAMPTRIEEANDRLQQAVNRDDAARFLRSLPRAVLLGVADLNYIEEAGNASMIEALLTERFGDVTTTASPMHPVVDADVIDALQYLDVWRSAGDSLDWDVAVIVYDVPTTVDVVGVRVPAGLYAREVTGDGRHVIAHRWTDRDALNVRLADVEARHAAYLHIVHARPVFVGAHAAEIDRYARAVIALIEADERDGGPLHDAPVRCWHDLHHHVDENEYIDSVGVPWGTDAVADDGDGHQFVTAVEARADGLLHERDRPLSVDEAEAAGFDGTLRDGSDPHTWASLTPRQRAALGLH
jgi:hypothetical protein